MTAEEYEVEYEKWLNEPVVLTLTRDELRCIFVAAKVRLNRPGAWKPAVIESGIEKLAEAYQKYLGLP